MKFITNIPKNILQILYIILLQSTLINALLSSTRTFNELNEISFRAYTDRRYPNKYQVIETEKISSLVTYGFKLDQKLIIIVHVFLEDILISNSPSQQLKNAYLEAGQQNIIIAHWRRKSNKPISVPEALLLYPFVSLRDAPKVGRIIAEFIAFINNKQLFPTSNIHMIGLSLGAHIAGSTGHHLQKSFLFKLDRITGLDPPGVLFYTVPENEKLSPDDAEFVDILHTDIIFLGTKEHLGHVDFFSNGGIREAQPGCRLGIIYPNYLDKAFCGHTSSVTIYINSLSQSMNACKCANLLGVCTMPRHGECQELTTFGEHGFKGARGSYYLKT